MIMKSLTMIECLCFIGDTSGTGTFGTGSLMDINSQLHTQFGMGDRKIICDGTIKPNTHYVYRYDERFAHPKSGEVGADVVIEVRTDEGRFLTRCYLYEING